MHNPDHLAKQGHTLTKLLLCAAGRARLWLLPATVLALGLCFGVLLPLTAVQAQDTGSGEPALVSYQLVVPPDMGRLCVGETKSASFTVVARILVPGGSTLGAVTPHSVRLSAASDNPGVLTVREAAAETPLLNELSTVEYVFSGIAEGSASVSIDAVVQGSELHRSLPVQVVPCQTYTVDMHDSWTTTINNANVLLEVTLHSELTADATGVFTDQPNVRWEATVNRFRGCFADHESLDTLRGNGGTLRGEIIDNVFNLTIDIRALDQGGILLDCRIPEAISRIPSVECAHHPDGTCDVAPIPNPTFTVDPITVRIPLRGGTVTVRHMTITLTPGAQGATNEGNPPGIMVQGNGSVIANGDNTPSVSDGTDFGATSLSTPVSHLFTIYAGSADLTLGDISVPDGFTLTLAPSSPVTAYNTTIFTVQCDATAAGTYSGTVVIPNNDSQANPYTFTVTCQVTGVPHMEVRASIRNQPGTPSIASGDTTPSVSDGTDFGSTTVGTPVVGPYWFILNNTGSADLRLGTISVPAGFSLTQAPLSVVQTNVGSPFIVQCDAASAGTFSGIISIPTNDPTQNPYTFAVTCQVTAPQMAVQGNGVSITNGDTTPSVSDDTDFSTTTLGSPVGHTFVIRNTGTADLTLGAISVPAGFSFVTLRNVHVPPADSSSLTVHCDATAAGMYSGTISIDNNDSQANPYTFTVTCQVSGVPQMAVQGNSIGIASGDTTPNTSNDTDFGSTTVGTPVIHGFFIGSTGSADLTLGTISVPAGFSLTSVPRGPVPAGHGAGIAVQCDATAAGTYSGMVSIANNDPTHNPYTFAVTCQVNAGVPQMALQGNGISIVNGDTTLSANDGTDFGTTTVGTPVSQSFYIANSGSADLTLGNITVPAGFTVTQVPGTPVRSGLGTGFALRCDSPNLFAASGTVSIPNNDPHQNPFTFAVNCRVNTPPWLDLRVSPDNGFHVTTVHNGDAMPVTNATDFGKTYTGIPVLRDVEIIDLGTSDLTLGTVTLPAGFSLAPAPAPVVTWIHSTNFGIQCDATAAGTYSGIVSIPNNDPHRNPFTFAIACQVNPPAPEISIKFTGISPTDYYYGSQPITVPNGDTTLSVRNNKGGYATNFHAIIGSSDTRYFAIVNYGVVDLTVGTVTVPAGFTVTDVPGAPIPPNGAPNPSDVFLSNFAIQCDATSAGTFSGTVSIASNDPNRNPYTFAITCQVNGAKMEVRGNSHVITSGDVTPSFADGTRYATTTVGTPVIQTFVIVNTGTLELTLGTISLPAGFSLTRVPSTIVHEAGIAGSFRTFDVQCDAASAGTYSGTVSIASSDPTQNPYTFTVTCQVNSRSIGNGANS